MRRTSRATRCRVGARAIRRQIEAGAACRSWLRESRRWWHSRRRLLWRGATRASLAANLAAALVRRRRCAVVEPRPRCRARQRHAPWARRGRPRRWWGRRGAVHGSAAAAHVDSDARGAARRVAARAGRTGRGGHAGHRARRWTATLLGVDVNAGGQHEQHGGGRTHGHAPRLDIVAQQVCFWPGLSAGRASRRGVACRAVASEPLHPPRLAD